MKHFRVTVTCQAVETSMMVCLDKDLQRDKIHDICKACVKDNYDIHITAIRLRHNDTTKWISLEQMVQELIELKLYKIKYEKVPDGMWDVKCSQAICIPDCISPVHAIIRKYHEGDQTVYINLDSKFDYLKIDYAAYAAELNRQDLKLTFRPWITSDSFPNGIGICADLPENAENAEVVIDCPLVNITWTEPTLRYEMKCIKTEL